MVRIYRPNDPLLAAQWLSTTVGSFFSPYVGTTLYLLDRVWADYRGAGVKVGVWDDGIQKSHWDLAPNYDASLQVTTLGNPNEGLPTAADDNHGTSVAGLIAADDNGRGGVGLAFDASVTGVKIFGGADDINTNLDRYLLTLDHLGDFDVTNHSYAYPIPDFVAGEDVAKFEASLVTGRGGLGTINLKAAGNEAINGAGFAIDATRATIVVAASEESGAVASYSNFGAHILISAPAVTDTTDRTGAAGYGTGDYTTTFGGTSAATPVVAGAVALMLSADEGLGWRDVQNILAYSAQGVGSFWGALPGYEYGHWFYNKAATLNGGGLHYSLDYGFGNVNVFGAVRMAEVWRVMHGGVAATSANEVQASGGGTGLDVRTVNGQTASYTFSVADQVRLEHVELHLEGRHGNLGELTLLLVSPSGTEIEVFSGATGNGISGDLGYTFGIEGFRGELSAGTWTLRVKDAAGGAVGKITAVGFTGFGAAEGVNDVYHLTSETGGRWRDFVTLSDADGGNDWVDGSSLVENLTLDLRGGANYRYNGYSVGQIAQGSVFENAFGGDGDDSLIGGGGDNTLGGMRGDDTLVGGLGVDTAWFLGSATDYVLAGVDGIVTVTSKLGGYGIDTLIGMELARFDDALMDLTALFPDRKPPEVVDGRSIRDVLFCDPRFSVRFAIDEWVVEGAGFITVHRADGSVAATLDISGDEVTVADRMVNILLPAALAGGARYYITVDGGAFKDLAGNENEQYGSMETTGFTTLRLEDLLMLGVPGRTNGTAKDDVIFGSDGNDTLNGAAGNDTIDGGTGNDGMSGGAGNDVYVVDAADRVTESAAGGYDLVWATGSAVTLANNVEELRVWGGQDFTGRGNATANRIVGGTGDDTLFGLAGNDTLESGAGDDRLLGGLGVDLLRGGAGADRFVFALATEAGRMPAPDTIADFESGADLIDLSLIDANTALRGRQAFTAVVDQFGGVAGQLQVTRIDGGVILSGDLNRDKVADFAIKVMGVDHLTLSDFIL